MVSSLPIDTFLVGPFHEDSISSFYLNLVTDRQTDKRRVKHNLLSGSNYVIDKYSTVRSIPYISVAPNYFH